MIPAIRVVFCFMLAFELLGAALGFWPDFDFSWLGLVATLGFVWYFLERLDARPWMWAVALGMLVLDAASAIFLLYSRIDYWDRLMHTMGGAAIATGVLAHLRRVAGSVPAESRSSFAGSVYIAVAVVGLGYEFLEYLVDRFYFGYFRTLVSPYDTIEDQLLNLSGATLVLLAHFTWTRWRGKVRILVPRVAHASAKESGR